ncbi:pyridoxal phosphate-dependent aminotransferase [Candidatus Bathyarchaeota archaeon]|nr:pyridoxal phosphate-dependent aminotransferase [Candidatus Bathyarchaeota archaeon]
MGSLFSDDSVRTELLRKHSKARWAALPEDVIPLTAADPDFQVAAEIREAIVEVGREGTFSYGESHGNLSFREVIAEAVRSRKGIPCTPGDIMVTSGVAQAMMIVAKYALEPGDEAILFDPVDFLFGKAVDEAGGKRVYSCVDKESRMFDVDGLSELVTPRTRLLCICNPHNPLGRVLTESELRGMAEVAADNDLVIMSDEIWSDIVYEGHSHVGTASLGQEVAERTVSLYGFSKTFAMAGLSLGYAVATDPEVMEGLKGAAPGYFYTVNSVSQAAGEAAYSKAWYWADAFLEHLHEQRGYVCDRLREMDGVRCHEPEGTYAVFPDISSFGMTSEEMSRYLLEEAKVAVVPGHGERFSYFGPGGEGNIRMVFSTSRGLVSEALDRVEKALGKL